MNKVLSGFQTDLVITGRHSASHREIPVESPKGHVVFFDAPASAVLQVGVSEDHCVCFVPLSSGVRAFLDGFEIPADGFGISPAGRGALFHIDSAGTFAVVWISNQAARVFSGTHGYNSMHKVRTFSRAEIPPTLREFPSEPSTNSATHEHAQKLESALLQALSAGWNSPGKQSTPPRTSCRAGVVHAIWNGVRSAPQNELSLVDWSNRLETSMRTVECAFRQITGLSPVGFIRTVRFAMSRELLRNNEVKTVKQAAYGCGLMHLGRYSIEYRLKFGEHPSETLAKAREAKA